MADVAPPDAMEGVVTTEAPPAADEAPPPQESDENACETLYIQNLNEKIKPDGLWRDFCLVYCTDDLSNSYQSLITRLVQILWRGVGCRCT